MINWGAVIIAAIAAIPPTVVAFMGRRATKKQIASVAADSTAKVAEVHMLVNSQMSKALAEIETLKTQVVALGGRVMEAP